ncbi:amino acid permease [Lysinibacillus sp. fkY74-1]|uniref:Amino acid permease n=3 Tax=Lysinibacillus TaxID=400634 RepID=W7S8L1_LYSSH|nr:MULTISPECIES: amino acid permease [Lysinibacillus]MBE5085091.1 amino acid permease [Bacillus thuringiensis]ACA39102.1 probable amino acid permease [Lysinibacillus sphaericus C3-41]AMR90207.1 amino acid transporter [Lysinibacillus sphaericus]ANA44257.1 amino acid transporter [Lysinibacillus sphaericus]EWH34571.1 amino acid permease [Lysinibacillus sphaericus CBAM5]
MLDNGDQFHNQQLNRSMKSRHLLMLSLGGVIGTGLFLNVGYTINQAGPGGALIGYLFGGLILFMVMNCLGELAVYMPVTGSFQTYATRFISPSAGFSLGWMYFVGSAATAGVEFTAAGILMQHWFPDIPIWIWCAVFMVLLFVLNALTTKGFAEAEFWFASIKVIAVIAFIIIGGAAIFGLIPLADRPTPHLTNLAPSGLFPAGISIIFVTMMNVIFSYQGSELVGIAAGETENPEKNIPRAIRTILFRIIVFYIASIIVLSAIFPSSELGLMESPFVTLMHIAGVPYAAGIMNFVILTAILSVGNSCLYASTRLLFSMSHEGMAPKLFGRLTKNKVPLNALIFTMAFSLLSLLTSVMEADAVFVLLMSVAGISVTISWMGICASQLMFRYRYIKSGGNLADLKFKTPLFPLIPIFCIFFCLVILIFLAFDPTQRIGLLYGIGFFIACMIFYRLKLKKASNATTDTKNEESSDIR